MMMMMMTSHYSSPLRGMSSLPEARQDSREDKLICPPTLDTCKTGPDFPTISKNDNYFDRTRIWSDPNNQSIKKQAESTAR